MITSHILANVQEHRKSIRSRQAIKPCILFIDEFDYVAKTRLSDEHGAIKRAVNMLLKSIDDISLVDDGVLMIGATNHQAFSIRPHGGDLTRSCRFHFQMPQ